MLHGLGAEVRSAGGRLTAGFSEGVTVLKWRVTVVPGVRIFGKYGTS